MAGTSISVGPYSIELHGNLGSFVPALSAKQLEPGLFHVDVEIESPSASRPPAFELKWSAPIVDVQTLWHSGAMRSRDLSPAWGSYIGSRATSNAPVLSLMNAQGENRHTFACSDALNPLRFKGGVHEETATSACAVSFFSEPHPPITRYSATLRIDTRHLPITRVLGDVSDFWARQPGYTPARVPEVARLPMYSTWYSFHQQLDVKEVVKQCQLSKKLGCEAVIVDDGWQTNDNGRGYAYCGDWEPERIGDMRAFVNAVHAAGHKFILWYSVPFVGRHSKAYERFKDKFINVSKSENGEVNFGAVDPRFPDVREYLINIYEKALRDWDLDGFKLDFVDSFWGTHEAVGALGHGRDYDSIPEAADRLLSDVITRLQAIKPDILVEFRQSYIGPLMRKYGNMFRAGDCPNDGITNRLRTIDIRLLCGNTAAHADMLMWHATDSVESAALQFTNILFSVPQISVLIEKIPQDHQEMLKFYLDFWLHWRDVLLDGTLSVTQPQALYPVITASNNDRAVVAVYEPMAAKLPDVRELALVNSTHENRVIVDAAAPMTRQLLLRDCRGRTVAQKQISIPAGISVIEIPRSGIALLSAQ